MCKHLFLINSVNTLLLLPRVGVLKLLVLVAVVFLFPGLDVCIGSSSNVSRRNRSSSIFWSWKNLSG